LLEANLGSSQMRGVHVSFCWFWQRSENVNRRTRAFCGRLRLQGFLEEQISTQEESTHGWDCDHAQGKT
jgi:hypothetical protein